MSVDTHAHSAAPPDLIDAVVDYFHPRRVILFGSAARGDTHPHSDFDLLVIVDDDTPRERLTLRAGHEARQSFRMPADIVPCRVSTFERKRKIPGTLSHVADREGVVVYERR